MSSELISVAAKGNIIAEVYNCRTGQEYEFEGQLVFKQHGRVFAFVREGDTCIEIRGEFDYVVGKKEDEFTDNAVVISAEQLRWIADCVEEFAEVEHPRLFQDVKP